MIIDLVITYVDNTNDDWKAKYRQFPDISYPMYYRTGKNALKYLLRSIDKNLPFINQVFLIVQNFSEIPRYVDTSKVRVITHEEFIPQEYLPTFNSNTIEAFFGNIIDLSEHFLYMNDDMLILNKLNESNFYTKDDKALSYFCKVSSNSSKGFKDLLIHNSELIYGTSHREVLEQGQIFSMNHTIRPYFKTVYQNFYHKYQDKISASLTRFRNKKNYSIYAVDLYQNLLDHSINTQTVTVNCLKNNASDCTIEKAFTSGADSLCILDVDGRVDIYENETFQHLLEAHFSTASKYEKEGNE